MIFISCTNKQYNINIVSMKIFKNKTKFSGLKVKKK